MLDGTTNSALLLALFPVFAVIGVSLNMFIRARGGRSFNLRLRGFGVNLTIETSPAKAATKVERSDNEI